MSIFLGGGQKHYQDAQDEEKKSSNGQSHCQRQSKCCNHRNGSYSLVPGGALGMGQMGASDDTSRTKVSQPGTEMIPLSHSAQAASGTAAGDGIEGLFGDLSKSDIQESLKGAPPNVLAAAQRMSLLPTMQRDVVTTAPGLDETDTGTLSEATLASQLVVAVRTRDLATVKRVCSQRSERLEAALKRRDGQGHTLVHWAAKAGDVDMLELLAASGAPTKEFSHESVGMTPLHWAATEGRLRASAWLLGPGGADPEGRDNQGCTALVVAAQYGFVELVIFLSNHGCNLGAVDNLGDSALHWAAYKGHVQVLSMLIKAGQDPEAEDSYGQTPLHLAALRGNMDAAEYLVMEARSNMNVRDKKNEAPLDLAKKKKQAAMELFLRTSGAGRSWASLSVFWAVARTPRIWRAACETGEGVQGSSWPLLLNLGAMAFGMWVLLQRFYSEEYLELEHSILLTVATFAQFLMWGAFMLTWISNPGYVDPTDPELSGAFHRRIGLLSGKTTGDSVGLGIRGSSRAELEGTIESLLGLESAQGKLARPACYTCCVEQPVRSRHCRVCRRCVRAFDHHCPFVGNCVGAGNYRWFFSYLVFVDVSAILHMVMCIDWLWNLGFSSVIVFSGAYVTFFGFFCIGLLLYHAQLVQANLTTNEHRRLGRVDYLLNPNESGQYFNPFDQGCFKNCLSRLTGTYDHPPSDLVTRLRGGEGRDIEMASFV